MSLKDQNSSIFSYSNNELFARTSNHNLHRRASPAEIKEHFISGSEKDHPAHWFEAQLIHYNLPASKAKSVARMRLLDASNRGDLIVPKQIALLEAKLRKDWMRDQREAKKKISKESDAPATGTKRKTGEPSNTPVKKAKVKQEGLSANEQSTPKFTKPQTARCSRGASSQTPSSRTSEDEPPFPVKKQTARSNRGGHSHGPGRASVKEESPSASPPRTIQTARRSHPFGMHSITPRGDTISMGFRNFHDSRESVGREAGSRLAPLGLLNGCYDIEAPWVKQQWSDLDDDDFTLVFTIAGNAMWAGFDLGVFSGVMFFPKRPRKSSMEKIPFLYRGREAEGPIMYGNHNGGWVRFLGGGQIEGQLGYMSIDFQGERHPGQGTTSPRSASDLEDEWKGYSEREYERERVGRWH